MRRRIALVCILFAWIGLAVVGQQPAEKVEVFVTNSGKLYHRAGCRYLKKSKIPISLEAAIQKYEPCSVCNPPLLPIKVDDVKWSMDYLEKSYGLKLTSTSVSDKDLKLVFEFGKDVDAKDIQEAFAPQEKTSKTNPEAIKLWFHFFDADNVILTKTWVDRTDGEMSGRKGDAFRVYLKTANLPANKTFKKVEVRPYESKDTKELKKETK